MVSLNCEMDNEDPQQGGSDPTPAQIRERAAEVRRRWSDRTRRRRRVKLRPTWIVPMIKVADISREVDRN